MPQCFQMLSAADASKWVCMWERGYVWLAINVANILFLYIKSIELSCALQSNALNTSLVGKVKHGKLEVQLVMSNKYPAKVDKLIQGNFSR